MNDSIVLKNVRTHNLKGIDISIPHRSLIVITGVSGSGKSSLAFDALYAEGRRRYVESLSTYARQFLERIEKPAIDSVQGILPAIAIEAKNVIQNARSTVGTQTELHDYLRLFFARIGVTCCTKCGAEIKRDSAESVCDAVFKDFKGESVWIAFSVALGLRAKNITRQIRDEFERQGFLRFVVSGREVTLEELAAKHLPVHEGKVLVIYDELSVAHQDRPRLVESCEAAFKWGKGNISVLTRKENSFAERKFSAGFHCAFCNIEYREPNPNLFSFNSPLGACPECQGFGRTITIDWNLVIPNPKLPLESGAIEPWTKPSCGWERGQLKKFCARRNIPLDRPFGSLSEKHKQWILQGVEGDDYFSVQDFFEYLEKKIYKMHVRIFLSRYRGYVPCTRCGGARLTPEALAVKVRGMNIAELGAMNIDSLHAFFTSLKLSPYEESVAELLLVEIRNRLGFLKEVGLGYLTLDRLSRTLSGGESQRIRLAASLGAALVDTLYVLDEPSVGLHERDNGLVIGLLKKLKELGNTVVVVEHDRTMIEAADQIIDLGPLGGERGGEVVFSGSFQGLLNAKNSHTARYFNRELVLERNRSVSNARKLGAALRVYGAREHNLKNISLEIPLRQFVVVTGVSGSGKSTLIHDVLYANYLRYRGRSVQGVGAVERIEGWDEVGDVYMIDQSPIGKTPRSNPVTYLKVFNEVRTLFAQTREARNKRLRPADFSFNVGGGRCGECEGDGVKNVEMHFLADVQITCETCGGSRYQPHILEIRYRGKNIRDVLEMTVHEAALFFEDSPRIRGPLSLLEQVGLGHLRLGQSAVTLSGGEAQRLKLASELSKGSGENLLYFFDEPTTGLHYYDIAALFAAFDTLLERGHSLCIIEHNMEVIKCADYVIDLGPEGGNEGGEVVYSGSVDGLVRERRSRTGEALKKYLFASARPASGII